MCLTVGSLFLTWERLSPGRQTPLPGALYTNLADLPSVVMVQGFHTSAHWPLTVGAICCGMTLLWTPEGKNRIPLGFVHGFGGLLCLLIALRWWMQSGFAFLPGILVALLGSLLLVFGAVDRFSVPSHSGE